MSSSLISSRFPSKVLLVGEYSVIKGGAALAIPYGRYYGHIQESSDSLESLPLNDFFQYLFTNANDFLNCDKIKEIQQKQYRFTSNIPQGMGLGSSAALCAAFYDLLKKESSHTLELETLKKNLGIMESFFHGKSSGIDPLISFIKMPIKIQNGILNSCTLPSWGAKLDGPSFFLLKTNIPRTTSPLVEKFLKRCDTDVRFFKDIQTDVSSWCSQLIENLCLGKFEKVNEYFGFISSWQRDNMTEMIPSATQKIWQAGSEADLFKLKLCGAGGGGVFLGFTQSLEETKNYFKRRFDLGPESLLPLPYPGP